MKKILIIDDDIDMCLMLERYFMRNHFEVRIKHSGKKGIEELGVYNPDVVLCDFRLGDTDGKELLKQIKEINPRVPVIIITGYSEVKMAVEVMKYGAYDYVTKPLFPDELLNTIQSAIKLAEGNGDAPVASSGTAANHINIIPQVTKKAGKSSNYIFGESSEFKDILRQMDLVGPTNYSVIIYGESGSGKEAIAHEIHGRSKRKNSPFVAIDCGALSKELSGSELFGHEKGSFTGALNQKIGNLELANGGTVFLDEIGNLSYDTQVSLLRVVQERKLRRIGGNSDISLDIRIIVASNENLLEATRSGKFREDLYHRFNEFSINVPPLRQRKDEVLTFAHFFLDKTNHELDKKVRFFSSEVENIFKQYNWPGNLRELNNVVKRSALLADGDVIEVKHLPFELVNHSRLMFDSMFDNEPGISTERITRIDTNFPLGNNTTAFGSDFNVEPIKIEKQTLKSASLEAEYGMILEALKKANYNKTKAAKVLNIDRKTLYNKMRQHNAFNEK